MPVETNFKITKIVIKKFHTILSGLSMEKDEFFYSCQWEFSVLLSIQYSAHGANSLLCSQHGLTNDIFLLLKTT